jgi:hypothetical protein
MSRHGFRITLSLRAKRGREREVLEKCSSRYIQEMERNRYSRALKRLLLCLCTRHVKVTVLSNPIRLCVQFGGEQEARKVESWPSYCEIKQNKEV